jgi:hypothetical protein
VVEDAVFRSQSVRAWVRIPLLSITVQKRNFSDPPNVELVVIKLKTFFSESASAGSANYGLLYFAASRSWGLITSLNLSLGVDSLSGQTTRRWIP